MDERLRFVAQLLDGEAREPDDIIGWRPPDTIVSDNGTEVT
jgi:hypothetical protein